MQIDAKRWEWLPLPVRKLSPLSGGNVESGQSDQIHVLPSNKAGLEGVVIAGWHLVATAKAKGEKTINGFLRHDFAGATAAEVAVEAEVLGFRGRCLSRLGRAKRLKHLLDVFAKLPRRFHPYNLACLKDDIGALFNIKRRAVDRDLCILDAPAADQQAYDAGLVGHADAAAIGALGQKEKARLAARIAAGEDVVTVVHECLPAKTGRHQQVRDGISMLAKSLARARVDLGDRFQEIAPWEIKPELSTLVWACDFLHQLVTRAQEDVPEDNLEQRLARQAL
jgi:hypothetical protein